VTYFFCQIEHGHLGYLLYLWHKGVSVDFQMKGGILESPWWLINQWIGWSVGHSFTKSCGELLPQFFATINLWILNNVVGCCNIFFSVTFNMANRQPSWFSVMPVTNWRGGIKSHPLIKLYFNYVWSTFSDNFWSAFCVFQAHFWKKTHSFKICALKNAMVFDN